MSSSHYQIKRWDPVMSGNSLNQHPAIYIEPDTAFLEFAMNNQFSLTCTISGTNSIYELTPLRGVVNQSGFVPNCRPNFFSQTGLYIITLDSDWHGYPAELGQVEFFGTFF